MSLSRRTFLKHSIASSLAAASLTGVGGALAGFQAKAQEVGGYRALVCVFLFGGLDNHDVVLPYDPPSYDAFAAIRSTLLAQQGDARSRENLLPLLTANPDQFGSRRFALPPELAGIKSIYDSGQAAVVANVGPLIVPTDRQSYDSQSVPLPLRLFSHNDQQATWQASAPEGAQLGWGGRFADVALDAGANGAPEFSTISGNGDGLFLTGQLAQPYNVSPGGADTMRLLDELEARPGRPGAAETLAQVRALLRNELYQGANVIAQDIGTAFRNAIDSNDRYNDALSGGDPLGTPFPESDLGQQLRAVAEAIQIRDSLQATRQVFFVGMGGFDTHSEQARALPELLADLDAAVSAFHSQMQESGLANDVTLFTASDFGRTLAVNGDGTDHGWGGHHFVVGGSVQGGAIYGDFPPVGFDHTQDAGNGRLIPTIAVEKFAQPLGSWFGLSAEQLDEALPNLANFAAEPDLTFL
ncbi:MAG: DUF1501 domain-containing protein [Pseudomonadota bacterium]